MVLQTLETFLGEKTPSCFPSRGKRLMTIFSEDPPLWEKYHDLLEVKATRPEDVRVARSDRPVLGRTKTKIELIAPWEDYNCNDNVPNGNCSHVRKVFIHVYGKAQLPTLYCTTAFNIKRQKDSCKVRTNQSWAPHKLRKTFYWSPHLLMIPKKILTRYYHLIQY